MQKTKAQTNGVAERAAMLDRQPVADGVGRLMAVIDDAVANLSTKGERELVREGIASVVKETLVELAEEQAQQRVLAAAPRGIGDAAEAGMNVAKQVQNLGFVEFTAGLINGTFDAIIGATVRQMDAYAKLVADLAKTLSQFQAENVSDAQINGHLSERYPDGQGGTVVRSDFVFTDSAASDGASAKKASEKLQDVVKALIAETISLKSPYALTRLADSLNIEENSTATSFTKEQVQTVRKAIGALLASSMMDQLRAMAREGMARIVITNGEIFTRLTFNVTSTEVDTKRQASYHRDAAGAYIHGRGGFIFGSVSAGASWNQVNIRTMNESTFDSLTMSADIIGQVRLNFKTETFPPATIEGGG